MNNDYLIKIYNATSNNGGKSIRELSKETGISPPTVSKYVMFLQATGSVEIEEMPPYRLVKRIE